MRSWSNGSSITDRSALQGETALRNSYQMEIGASWELDVWGADSTLQTPLIAGRKPGADALRGPPAAASH